MKIRLKEYKKDPLKETIIDTLDYLIEFEDIFPFPKGKYLAHSWQDWKDDVYYGNTSDLDDAESLLNYLNKQLDFERRRPEVFEDDTQAQLTLDTYNRLQNAFNRKISLLHDEDELDEGILNDLSRVGSAIKDSVKDSEWYKNNIQTKVDKVKNSVAYKNISNAVKTTDAYAAAKKARNGVKNVWNAAKEIEHDNNRKAADYTVTVNGKQYNANDLIYTYKGQKITPDEYVQMNALKAKNVEIKVPRKSRNSNILHEDGYPDWIQDTRDDPRSPIYDGPDLEETTEADTVTTDFKISFDIVDGICKNEKDLLDSENEPYISDKYSADVEYEDCFQEILESIISLPETQEDGSYVVEGIAKVPIDVTIEKEIYDGDVETTIGDVTIDYWGNKTKIVSINIKKG